MARNSEKSNSALNRWRLMQNEKEIGNLQYRPKHPYQCKTLQEARYWKQMTTKEMAQKIGEIQNERLDEEAIKALNIKINQLNRERCLYERKIDVLMGVLDESELKQKIHVPFHYFGLAKGLNNSNKSIENNQNEMNNSNDSKRNEMRRTGMFRWELRQLNDFYYGLNCDNEDELIEEENKIANELKEMKKNEIIGMEIENKFDEENDSNEFFNYSNDFEDEQFSEKETKENNNEDEMEEENSENERDKFDEQFENGFENEKEEEIDSDDFFNNYNNYDYDDFENNEENNENEKKQDNKNNTNNDEYDDLEDFMNMENEFED